MQTGTRALPNTPGQNFSDLANLAIFHYAGATYANPTYDPTVDIPVSTVPLVETNLHVGAVMIIATLGLTFPCPAADILSCFTFYYVYLLYHNQWSHPFQPGKPFPSGADINISLEVTFVRSRLKL